MERTRRSERRSAIECPSPAGTSRHMSDGPGRLSLLHLWYFVLALIVVSIGECRACECGRAVTPRIFKGHPVESSTYPWMGLLLTEFKDSNGVSQCGATLIAPQYVITAKHCLSDAKDAYSYVVFDAKGLGDGVNSQKKYNFDTVTLIEAEGDVRDIAVIKLRETVDRMPICLPPKDKTFAGAQGKILGYGGLENGETSEELMEGDITIPSQEDCAKVEQIDDDMICGGNYDGAAAFCGGDSGGPMMSQTESGQWEIAGIITLSLGCSSTDTYGIGTRVTSYLDLIEDTAERTTCVV